MCVCFAEIQDDEVVESVVRDRKRELPLERIHTLAEDSFLSFLAETNHTAVLFYASCKSDFARCCAVWFWCLLFALVLFRI